MIENQINESLKTELEKNDVKIVLDSKAEDLSFSVNEFFDLLDEAKKEFPDYIMFDPEYSKNDPYITHQKWTLDEKNSFLKQKRDEWLIKWFGT